MTLQFKKATKTQGRLRMALIGPAGGGKTFTALRIATYLGGPIALIDTERGSASKYAGEPLPDGSRFEFDVMEPDDFSPETYVAAIRAAESAGYRVLIIDSLSHAWMGKGGALEMVDRAAKRERGNSFAAWRDVTPMHNAMVEAIISARLHIIATMRSKMEYVQEKDEKTGKTVIRKIGLQPVQRDGLEYEFDLVADLDQDNNLIVGKTRCSRLSGMVIKRAGKEIAETLMAWLTDGAEAEPTKPSAVTRFSSTAPPSTGSPPRHATAQPAQAPLLTVVNTQPTLDLDDPSIPPQQLREELVRLILTTAAEIKYIKVKDKRRAFNLDLLELMVNQKHQVTDGINSLQPPDLRTVYNWLRDEREKEAKREAIQAELASQKIEMSVFAKEIAAKYNGRELDDLSLDELIEAHEALSMQAIPF